MVDFFTPATVLARETWIVRTANIMRCLDRVTAGLYVKEGLWLSVKRFLDSSE